MPYGTGTYGSKVGRPPKKKKAKAKKKKNKNVFNDIFRFTTKIKRIWC